MIYQERRKEEIETMRDNLINYGIATEEELNLITNINGYSIETLNDVLYAKTGYRDRKQYKEEF